MKFEPLRPGEPDLLGGFKRASAIIPSARTRPSRAAAFSARFILGSMGSGAGEVPLVSTRLGLRDRFGAIGTRLGIGRNRYRVTPGLYAVGAPGRESPVLVSANYKLSFDSLRKELGGLDAWILVLDTKGVNVWCSAGKGTFGNAELARRIGMTRLGLVVSHRCLILPQLAATGVGAPAFQRENGWSVRYGPVLSRDIPAYLAAGRVKSGSMRRMDFPFLERLKLVPLEIVHPLPRFLLLLAAWVLAAFLGLLVHGIPAGGLGAPFLHAVEKAFLAWLAIFGALVAGSGIVPAFLPWIPFRAFTLKGLFVGAIYATALIAAAQTGPFESIALLLALPSISAWYALNFTGSTTYTSLAGVRVEVAAARLPLLISMAGGLILRTIQLIGFGT
jgi:hypothetical protein